MITSFEHLTQNITDQEIETAKLIAKGLELRIGKETAISNSEIRAIMFEKYGYKISDVKFRRMINYIRRANLVTRLCACYKGYYSAKNDTEWNEWKESMQQRINEQQAVLDIAIYFNDGKETL